MRIPRRAFLVRASAGAGALIVAPLVRAEDRGSPRRTGTFKPPIGITAGPEQAAKLRELGADYVEVPCSGTLVPDRPDEEFAPKRKQLLECGLPVLAANLFLPGRLRCTGPDADHAAVAAYAEVAFRRAEEVGIRAITFGSSGARSLPEGFPHADGELQFVALLARLAPLAERHGVVICVENLQSSETNFIRKVREARRLVQAVQHPNVALTADVFHMLREGEDAAAIREAGPLVKHVHIAEKRARSSPGVDGDDFTAYFQALNDAGFDGLVSMECGWEDLETQLPVALATLRRQMADVQ